MQVLCDFARITLNKNTVPGDASAMNPGGVRIGSPAMTSRGAQAPHFVQIARFFDEAVKLARLALVAATAQVLHNGLAVLGVSAPQKM